jgi:hypothetical protein
MKSDEELLTAWGRTRMLDDFRDEDKLNLCYLLETQLAFNNYCQHNNTVFIRLSIPIVRRLVAVNNNFLKMKSGRSEKIPINNYCLTGLLDNIFYDFEKARLRYQIMLDYECDIIFNLIEKSSKKLNRILNHNNNAIFMGLDIAYIIKNDTEFKGNLIFRWWNKTNYLFY